MSRKVKSVYRESTPAEREMLAHVSRDIEQEFPPLVPPREPSAQTRMAIEFRRARLAAGLTEADVATRSGFSVAEVRKVEMGRDVPWLCVLAIATVLGLSLQFVPAET
jgi:DNA-binding transcriptional regulator YiaG